MKVLRGTLTFVLGMIVGILLFVIAIGGTVVIIGTSMTVGDIQETLDIEIIDKDSELGGKTILDAITMVMDDVQQFDKLSIQTLIDKYGLPIPTEISGIDITEAFKYPIVELGDHINEIVNSVSLGEITTAFEIEIGNLPILTDNLDKGVTEVVNILLASINGDMTLRAIKTNFGIDIGIGENKLLVNMQDAPFGNLGAIINGLRLESILEASTDSFVPATISTVYNAVDVYEEVSATDLANENYTAPFGVDTYIENGIDTNNDGTTDTLVERELRFVKKNLANGTVKYDVDNSCYQDDFDATTTEKTFYRHVSYQTIDSGEAIDASTAYVEIFGNKITQTDGATYSLHSKGLAKLADLATKGIATFEPSANTIAVSGTAYGVVDSPITTASKLDETGSGYIKVEEGTSAAVLQSVAFLTINELQTSSDFITNLKLGDVIDIDQDSVQILQTLKDSTLGSIADDVATLELGDIINIVDGESPGILVALKGSTLETISDDINGVTLGDAIEVTEDSPQILISLQNTSLGDLSSTMNTLKLGDAIKIVFDTFTVDANGKYAKVGEGKNAYYTLYNEAVHFGTPRYARTPVDGSASKILQRFANIGINDFATAFDNLILGDVMDIDTDILARVSNADALLDTTVAYFYYDETNGLYRSASIGEITLNDNGKYDYVYKVTAEGTASTILKKLAFVQVNNLATAMEDIMDDMLLGDVMDITMDTYTPDETGMGRYALVQEGASSYYTLYNEALHAGTTHYTKTDVVGASSSILQRFAGASISQFSTAFDSLILGDVLEIDTDLYKKVLKADAQANTSVSYYYFDNAKGIYRLADADYIEANEYVFKIEEEGTSSAMLKKLAFVKVNDLSTAMEDIMDDMLLSDVMEITMDNYALDETGLGRYVLVQDGASSYYTLYNEALHEGMDHYGKEAVTGSSSQVLQRLKDVSISKFASAFDGLVLGDVLNIDTDLYTKVAQADALANPDEVYYYFDSATGLYRLADATYINSNPHVYKVFAVGTSNNMLKKLAFVKVNDLSTAMEGVVNDMFITDLMEVYSNYVVKENNDGLVEEGDFFVIAPYLEDGEYVLQNGKKITYAYNDEGRYIQRGYKFVETAPADLTARQNGTISYKYVAFSTVSDALQKAQIVAAQNLYYYDGSNFVYNVPLVTYLIARNDLSKIYYRQLSSEEGSIESPTYDNTAGDVYVLSRALGQYVPYDATSIIHAQNEHYYIKKTAQNGETYFVNVSSPLPSDDLTDYAYKEGVDKLFAKQYCEEIYVENAEGDWVLMGGKFVSYDSQNPAHATLARYNVKEGYVATRFEAYYTVGGTPASSLNPIKVDIVHEKSANVLQIMANSKVTVDKMSNIIEEATISDLMMVQPDTIFDSNMFDGIAITNMGNAFGRILNEMTIGQLLEWGNFTDIDQRIKDALENVTFKKFIDSLTITDAGIVVDMEIALGYKTK